AVLAIGVSVVAGGAHLRFVALRGSSLGAAGPVLLGLLCAALSEELLFRGYPLRRLSEAVGPAGATLLLSGGFAASHIGNPNATALGVVNIALAGFWLSVAFFSPGGMTLAWGAHFGWNAALGELFDAPVSGYSLAAPVVHYAPGGHAWLDGGRFGPEGGVVATIAFLAGAAALLGSRLTQPWGASGPARGPRPQRAPTWWSKPRPRTPRSSSSCFASSTHARRRAPFLRAIRPRSRSRRSPPRPDGRPR